MLIASMNPCRCGYYGSDDNRCRCSESSINNYLSKISGPLLDRIDLQIEVKQVNYKKISSKENSETSDRIKKRVDVARNIQNERYSNLEISPKLIEKYCKIDNESKKLLQKVFEKFRLSGRAYSRILKLARTIADLDEEENIMKKHIAEAIQYRVLDRKYWRSKY